MKKSPTPEIPPYQNSLFTIFFTGFGQYKDPFIQNDITGRSLKSLSLQSLKIELNVQSLGHRTSILEHIKKLFKERKLEDSPNKLSSSIEIIVTGNGQDIEIKDARFPGNLTFFNFINIIIIIILYIFVILLFIF